MASSDILLEYYQETIQEFNLDEDNPMFDLLTGFANIFGTILDQVKTFLDGVALLIIRLVNYAKQILTTPKFPKKIKKAINAIRDVVESVTSIFTIPLQFAETGQQIINTFLKPLQALGSVSLNLYSLASSVLDITFFGDMIFKPLLSSINLPQVSILEGLSSDVTPSPTDVVLPYIKFLTQVILAPLLFIKSLLEPLKPVWNFIKSLVGASPIKFVKAVGKLPSVLSKVISFLLSILNVFTALPLSLLDLLEIPANQILSPILSDSIGLQQLSISELVSQMLSFLGSVFTTGLSGIVSTINSIGATNPTIGMLVPIFILIKGSILGAIEVLFGPILSIIGVSLQLNGSTSEGYTITQIGSPTYEEFTQIELNRARFELKWYTHQAWTNSLNMFTLAEREDILFGDFVDDITIVPDFEIVGAVS